MPDAPVQVLEVRAFGGGGQVTITAAVSAAANGAIFTALSEQLDRRRAAPLANLDAVLAMRDQIALAERFEPLSAAGVHGVVSFSETDLRSCLLELTDYAERVDGDHFQPAELRERLQVIAEIVPVLWDANASAAAAGAASADAALPAAGL